MKALEKMAKLVEILAERTERDEIEWQESSPGRFVASLTKMHVFVAVAQSDYDPDADPTFYVGLESNSGVVIDSVTDGDIAKYLSNSFTSMRSLYHGARRKARNVESLVDQALSALDGDAL